MNKRPYVSRASYPTSVAVIGAGLAGLTTAYWLTRLGIPVTIIDAKPGPGEGTSFANGGMLTPSQSNPWNAPGTIRHLSSWIWHKDSPLKIYPSALPHLIGWGARFLWDSWPSRYRRWTARNFILGHYSLEQLKLLVRETGLHFDRESHGTLQVFREQAEIDARMPIMDFMSRRGLDVQRLDRERLADLEPVFDDDRSPFVGGLYFPKDESGDAFLFCEGLAGWLALMGVTFCYGSGVERLDVESGKVRAAVTADDTIKADAFVVACGPGSRILLHNCGIHCPIYPAKGYSLTVDIGAANSGPRLPVVDMHDEICVTPLGRRLRIAGSVEFCGYDLTIDAKRSEANPQPSAQSRAAAASISGQRILPLDGPASCHPDGLPDAGAFPPR
ncbi:FAD-dependent oxidoreductase [Brucella endophytica]|nr:FAD-dependent oxidoreductase [Brucella endophytica]